MRTAAHPSYEQSIVKTKFGQTQGNPRVWPTSIFTCHVLVLDNRRVCPTLVLHSNIRGFAPLGTAGFR